MTVAHGVMAHNGSNGISNTANPLGNATSTITNSIRAYNAEVGLFNNINTMDASFVAHDLFWANGTGPLVGFSATGFGYNSTTNANGDSSDVNFNLFADPIFCDPDTLVRDYPLSLANLVSPAIDAGTSVILGTVMTDPDLTLPDIGNEAREVWQCPPAMSIGQTGTSDSAPNLALLASWDEQRVHETPPDNYHNIKPSGRSADKAWNAMVLIVPSDKRPLYPAKA